MRRSRRGGYRATFPQNVDELGSETMVLIVSHDAERAMRWFCARCDLEFDLGGVSVARGCASIIEHGQYRCPGFVPGDGIAVMREPEGVE